MEKEKKRGVVSTKKIAAYLKRNKLLSTYTGSNITASTGYSKKSKIAFYDITNKRKTNIANIGLKNKKSPRAVWWVVD